MTVVLLSSRYLTQFSIRLSLFITISSNNNTFSEKYTDIYDNIIVDPVKNNFFIDAIEKNTILDLNKSIVNIGCKNGDINKNLDDRKINSIGLDNSKSMINFCRNKYSNINFDIFDILNAGCTCDCES